MTFRKIPAVLCAAALLGGALLYWALAGAAIADLDEQPVGYVSALDMNNYNVQSGASVAYRGDYFAGTWDGDLVAYDVPATGLPSVKWQSRDRLEAQNWNTGRKIFTRANASGVPFAWAADGTSLLTAAQKAELGSDPQGRYLLEFTRGDRSREGVAFRKRYSVLGDIIHSRPYFFRHAAGVERVYVGANDGMLHAFNAADGSEVFAYLPSMLIPKLDQFAVNPYTHHKYGVDGLLAIGKVPRSGKSITVLAGGMGAGARGVFALDVTDPSPATETAAAAMSLWEVAETTAGFENMGHVSGAPQIVKLKNGSTVVLVANGANSAAGKAVLFVIDAATGSRLAEIPADAAGPDNGLMALSAADVNGDGAVDSVYAGDLKGTLWKFDLGGSSYPASGKAMFTPTAGTARAITAAPALSLHPNGGVMVNFGTGRLLEPADMGTGGTDYLYGIWDSVNATSTTLALPTLTTATTPGTPAQSYRSASQVAVDYAKGAKGWRLALPAGERLVGGDTVVDSGRFIVTTSVPQGGSSPQGAWLMELNALTGGGPSVPFFDLDGDGTVDVSGNSDRVSISGTWVTPVGKFLGAGLWSQPVLAQVGAILDRTYFNFNPNADLPALVTTSTLVVTTSTVDIPPTPVPPGDRGVSGGHFDFDIFYSVCDPLGKDYKGSCTNKHVHEYDDLYDVVGVNMLSASEAAFNLNNAIPSTATGFKLLVANQKLSPAAALTVGTLTKPVWNLPVSPEGFLSATPGGPAIVLTRANIGKLIISLPVNAFSIQEWRAGSKDVRAGLVPTQTGCVHDNKGAQGTGTGPWMNGALTLQIVSSDTSASAVQLNMPGDPAMGHRLKSDKTSQGKQLAQYTMFWHHPNKVCYGDAGWTASPPPDPTQGDKSKPRAAGSSDPTGSFWGATGSGGSTTTTVSTSVWRETTTYNGVEAYATMTYDAVKDEYTRVIYNRATGSVIKTETFRSDNDKRIQPKDAQSSERPRLGRLSWQELIR
ncbi:MAG: PilC/PilY family type IV pilus protein [Pseudomonadota bacterium]